MNDDTAFTNRLANETSPYLLQHSHNPVDWYPWGDEALARARTEDKPILLSIGYSACHWCHVMAHESFENAETAALMNELFVNVKVDREERPDLDNIYMQAVQLLTHSGGWPLTVFLKPDGAPFYGGTYFPPADRYGMPSFSTVLHAISDAYQSRRAEVEKSAAQLVDALRTAVSLPDVAGSIDQETLDEACANIARTFDGRLGGFGRAPKFPAGMVMDFLLRHHARTARPDALFMVELTLEKMARGGIYDQIGGGFARYSVDERWLVPHFEKMLYDNAILARNYLDAHRITNKPFYRRIVEETLDFVIREMMSPVGAFYSAYDADSEGHEGKFYVWEPDEVNAVLGQPDGHLFCAFYDVSKEGNFEGKNILNVPRTLDEVAVAERVDPEHLHQVLERGRRELYAVRSKRVWPGLDDKALAAWNGLMLRAFAEAGGALDRMDYVDVARRNAEFILESMRDGKKLLRTYKDGAAKLNAYLEDYAFVIEGLVSLYEATFETRWLVEAKNLADVMIAEFWDESADGFFFTGSSHEQLLRRTKEFEDNATPSGNSSAANGLLRLAELTSEESYRTYADRVLNVTAGALGRYARAFGHMLCAADFRLAPPMEIAIVGEPEDDATHALSREARAHYVAARVLAGSRPGDEEAATIVPLLRDRGLVDGMPAAHVCRNFACKLPVTDVEALREDLDAG